MTTKVQKDLERTQRHSEWLAWWKSPKTDKGPDPGPGYKDCRNCPLREEYDEPEERAEFCVTQCPYADEPSGPSRRYIEANLWANLPDVFLAEYGMEIGLSMCMDVQAIKNYREDQKWSAALGVSALGR